ncbi:VanZ family protein [Clostridium sp. C2-6-12]|uniref:VanZ family protein n=1 Tax=Clostridium sp. C2-6-12 TaxID=2698832 RepID=UPI00136C0047|nr:VanZ family protein [Clostridium sp. C2-6-12]
MNNKRKVIYWSLLIGWMIFIFIMSNQPAKISDSQSFGVLNLFNKLGIDIEGVFGEFANFVVRKCAHFIEYMILGLFTFNVLRLYYKLKQASIITILCIFIYACSDEIHQLFVIGREGSIRDVLIDTCGGIVLVTMRLIILQIKEFDIKKKLNKLFIENSS